MEKKTPSLFFFLLCSEKGEKKKREERRGGGRGRERRGEERRTLVLSFLKSLPVEMLAPLLCAFLLIHASVGEGLVDDPVVGEFVQSLNGRFQVQVPTLPLFSGSVPGDLLTDMQREGLIGDPLFGNNFDFYDDAGVVQPPLWEQGNVTYTSYFEMDPAIAQSSGEVLLVLDGIKMASGVWLNGQYLGTTANQFVRWSYPVRALLRPGGAATQELRVEFVVATDAANHQARFMACSGGWDWAPYTGLTVGNHNGVSRAFSKGIWKDVSLVALAPAALTALKVLSFYTGPYPTAPLTDATAAPFEVQVTAFFWAPAPFSGTLGVSGADWGGGTRQAHLSLPAGASSANLTLPASGVRLWWANGMGAQPLYTVAATFTPDTAGQPPLAASRRLGFRVAHLVTVNDTYPSQFAGAEGTGNQTMRFKLNGADLYVRGGNMIPMEELEGRRNATAYRLLVNSSVAANFNTFRVWGGGIYLDDAFFDACDELGVMLYEDVMFGSDGRLDPVGNDLELAELQYQVRRLAHHPSIFLWSACNECGGGGTYESFVSPTIAAEDPSRVIWPSCPSLGWATGVHTLTGLPNGNALKIISAGGVAAVRRVPCAASAGTACTLVEGADYDSGGQYGNTPAATAQACCDLCAEAGSARCYAASFWQGLCFFKPLGNSTMVAKAGVTSVFPPGSTPPPIAPSPCAPAESHGPYTHGYSASFPAVNGQNDVVNINLPPATAQPSLADKGRDACGFFTSEFGASVFSSFESMAPTLDPKNWALWGAEAPAKCTGSPWGRPCVGSNPLAQRNYPGDNFNLAFFGPQDFNTSGAQQLSTSLYFNMAAQALEKKGDIEVRRSKNHWGSITWQANEIWRE